MEAFYQRILQARAGKYPGMIMVIGVEGALDDGMLQSTLQFLGGQQPRSSMTNKNAYSSLDETKVFMVTVGKQDPIAHYYIQDIEVRKRI
jgi:hypothetical protein